MVVTLCLGETCVGAFLESPQPASSVFETSSPASVGENYDASQYDASGYAVAPKSGLVNPAELRWSQTTAGGRGRAALYRKDLAKNGWKEGEFIDVVRTPDGLATLDHTRAAVALELKIPGVPARFHLPSDPLQADMLTRGWNRAGDTATTWGEALRLRGAGQTPPIGPTGSSTPPRLPR
jgi:hypothetical protein